jgi:hypothetical protein
VLFFSAFVHFCTIFTLFSPNFQSPIPRQNWQQNNLEKIIELAYKKDGLFFEGTVREKSSSFEAVFQISGLTTCHLGGRGGEKSNKPGIRTIEAGLYCLFGDGIPREMADSFSKVEKGSDHDGRNQILS